ncbi:3-oxoacyl-ACP reductase, partial [Burkholderia cenocepacia]|nr:3-oxoacyl-ACP reductase [Burkholderia cenocepacia]
MGWRQKYWFDSRNRWAYITTMARRMAAARRQNRNEERIVTVEKVALITAAGKGMGAAIAR